MKTSKKKKDHRYTVQIDCQRQMVEEMGEMGKVSQKAKTSSYKRSNP